MVVGISTQLRCSPSRTHSCMQPPSCSSASTSLLFRPALHLGPYLQPHAGTPFFFFSRDDVTEPSTPLGGGQREEPRHQEPSRPKPALQQAPRARRRRDRTGRDRTKTKRRRRAQRGPARTRTSTQASTHARTHARKQAHTQASKHAGSTQASKQAERPQRPREKEKGSTGHLQQAHRADKKRPN